MSGKKVITEDDVKKQGSVDLAKPVDAQLYQPGKYEITPDHTFRVDLFIKQIDNRWVVVKKMAKDVEHHWVEFKMWPFIEEVELRKMSTTYDPSKRVHFIDHDVLNRLKIQRLMKSWSFEKDNPNLKLHHVNGVLTDEGYKAFTNLFPNLVRAILEGMNSVLEYNG